MTLHLILPKGIVYSGEVSSVTLPTLLGQVTILPHHAPLISVLKEGEIKIHKTDGKEISYKIDSGIVEVSGDTINVLLSF